MAVAQTWFSASRGGVICRNCEGAVPDRSEWDGRLLGLLQTLLRLPRQNGAVVRLPQLTRHQTDPINRLLSNHIQQTLGKGLRMPAWILSR